jgi:hypothetical protein
MIIANYIITDNIDIPLEEVVQPPTLITHEEALHIFYILYYYEKKYKFGNINLLLTLKQYKKKSFIGFIILGNKSG